MSRADGSAKHPYRGLIVIAVMVLVGGLAFANAQGRFDHLVTATTRLPTVGGAIEKGADVKLDGVVVGKVTSVTHVGKGSGVDVALGFTARQATTLPGNATVRVLPVNIFGAAYVELVQPARIDRGLRDGARLKADHSPATVELGDMLQATEDIVDALGPADLATSLNTFADAFYQRGDDLGRMIESAERVVVRLNRLTPELREDLRLSAEFFAVVAEVAPDLFSALEDGLVVGTTLIETEKSFQALVRSLADVSSAGQVLVDENAEALVTGLPLFARLVHTLSLGRRDIPRVIDAVIHLARDGSKALEYGPFLRVDAGLRTSDEADYGPADCPSYDGLRGRGCPGGAR